MQQPLHTSNDLVPIQSARYRTLSNNERFLPYNPHEHSHVYRADAHPRRHSRVAIGDAESDPEPTERKRIAVAVLLTTIITA